jgi:hypothetical protein
MEDEIFELIGRLIAMLQDVAIIFHYTSDSIRRASLLFFKHPYPRSVLYPAERPECYSEDALLPSGLRPYDTLFNDVPKSTPLS